MRPERRSSLREPLTRTGNAPTHHLTRCWDCASAEIRRAPSSTSSPPTRSRTAWPGGTFRSSTERGGDTCCATPAARPSHDVSRTPASRPAQTRVGTRTSRVGSGCSRAVTSPIVDDAEPRLRRAEATFRDGDMVLELAETLVVLAEQRRRDGSLDDASSRVRRGDRDRRTARARADARLGARGARPHPRRPRHGRRPAACPRRRRSCAAARDEGPPAPVAGARRARQPRAHRLRRGHRRRLGREGGRAARHARPRRPRPRPAGDRRSQGRRPAKKTRTTSRDDPYTVQSRRRFCRSLGS